MADKTREDGLENGQENRLKAFFDAARQAPEPVSEALTARVLDDALAVQAARAGAGGAARGSAGARPGQRAFTGLFAGLGGWPAMAGLATAAGVGLWIGFSPDLGVGEAMTSALDASGLNDAAYAGFGTGFDFAFENGAFDEGDAG